MCIDTLLLTLHASTWTGDLTNPWIFGNISLNVVEKCLNFTLSAMYKPCFGDIAVKKSYPFHRYIFLFYNGWDRRPQSWFFVECLFREVLIALIMRLSSIFSVLQWGSMLLYDNNLWHISVPINSIFAGWPCIAVKREVSLHGI